MLVFMNRGQLAVDGAPASAFYGWLGLIDELRRAATPGGRTPEDEISREPGGEP
jgi:hypothetical protein